MSENIKNCIKVLENMLAWEESDAKIYALNEAIDALNKQLPEKVEAGTEGGFDLYCKCGNFISVSKAKHIQYCTKCGQKLDWD